MTSSPPAPVLHPPAPSEGAATRGSTPPPLKKPFSLHPLVWMGGGAALAFLIVGLWLWASGREGAGAPAGKDSARIDPPKGKEAPAAPARKPLIARKLRASEALRNPVRFLAVSRDGARAVTLEVNGQGKVWSLADGRPPALDAAHNLSIQGFCVALSGDGKRVVVGTDRLSLRLWDVESGRVLHSSEGEESDAHQVALSFDGKRAAVVHNGLGIQVRDPETGRKTAGYTGRVRNVTGTCFLPDGQRVLTAADRTLTLWFADTGKESRTYFGHDAPIFGLALSADGHLAATSGGDRRTIIWDVDAGREASRIDWAPQGMGSWSFSPDGKVLAVGSDEGELRFFEAPSGKDLGRHAGREYAVRCVTFLDANHLLLAGLDNALQVWEVAEGAPAGP